MVRGVLALFNWIKRVFIGSVEHHWSERQHVLCYVDVHACCGLFCSPGKQIDRVRANSSELTRVNDKWNLMVHFDKASFFGFHACICQCVWKKLVNNRWKLNYDRENSGQDTIHGTRVKNGTCLIRCLYPKRPFVQPWFSGENLIIAQNFAQNRFYSYLYLLQLSPKIISFLHWFSDEFLQILTSWFLDYLKLFLKESNLII